jgi:hypothetical protein
MPSTTRLISPVRAAFPGLVIVGLFILALAGVPIPKPDFLYNIHYEVSQGHIDWDDYQAKLSDRGNPWEILYKQPGSVMLASLANIPKHLENVFVNGGGPALGLFALLGILSLFTSAPTRGTARRFAACWLLQFVLLLPTQASERYALTQIPFLAVLSAWGIDGLLARALRPIPLLAAVILSAGIAFSGIQQITYQKRQPRFLLETARQLEGQVRPTDRIMARRGMLHCHENLDPSKTAWCAVPAAS